MKYSFVINNNHANIVLEPKLKVVEKIINDIINKNKYDLIDTLLYNDKFNYTCEDISYVLENNSLYITDNINKKKINFDIASFRTLMNKLFEYEKEQLGECIYLKEKGTNDEYNSIINEIYTEFTSTCDDEELINDFKKYVKDNYSKIIAYMIDTKDTEGLNEIRLIFKYYSSLSYEEKCKEFKKDLNLDSLKLLSSRISYLYECYINGEDISNLTSLEYIDSKLEENEKLYLLITNKDDAKTKSMYENNIIRLNEIKDKLLDSKITK